MGSAIKAAPIPLVEIGQVPEILFTEIEVEVLAGDCARFLLFVEQRPVDCWPGNGAPENVLRMRATTPIDLVPRFIRKTVYELSRHWGRDAMSGLLIPH